VNWKVSNSNIVWCERYKNKKLLVREKKVASADLKACVSSPDSGTAEMVLRKSTLVKKGKYFKNV
jgi:hypothetical protein